MNTQQAAALLEIVQENDYRILIYDLRSNRSNNNATLIVSRYEIALSAGAEWQPVTLENLIKAIELFTA